MIEALEPQQEQRENKQEESRNKLMELGPAATRCDWYRTALENWTLRSYTLFLLLKLNEPPRLVSPLTRISAKRIHSKNNKEQGF